MFGEHPRSGKPGRWAPLLEVGGPWAAVLAAAVLLLGALVQAGQQGLWQAQQQARQAAALAALVQRIEVDLATGAALAPGSVVQARLEEALAHAPDLQAIDLAGTEGRLLLSTERSAVGDPAPTRAPQAVVTDAAGTVTGRLWLVPRADAAPDDAPLLAPGTLAAAASVLLLALLLHAALAPPAPERAPALSAARRRLAQAQARLARIGAAVQAVSDEDGQGFVDTRPGPPDDTVPASAEEAAA